LHIPELSPSIRRRGNALTRGLAALVLRVMGWRFEGEVPAGPRVVTIVAPHTSNWDFVVGLSAAVALGIPFRFLGKDALFRPPLGGFMRFMGGIPVVRSSPEGLVEAAAATLRDSPALFLAIAPEGTRRRVEKWKTGFWRIAKATDAVVWPVALDWSRRVVALGAPFTVTDDMDADLRALQSLYRPEMAHRPADYGVAVLDPLEPSSRTLHGDLE
jgi:1-acyl-sn-glycerol-3-phosphate acyltransferase